VPAALLRPCGAEPAERAGGSPLPAGFPRVSGVVYTARRLAGPTTIVTGFMRVGVKSAHDAYVTAFPVAHYLVLREELDPADSEVVFSGGRTTGQVTLTQECRSRTRVRITIRPS
jgi:hypothetical protein